jgi:Asp/Glu/hydantoin racemase
MSKVGNIPRPVNEPINSHAPGTPERAALKSAIDELLKEKLDIPLYINGKERRTGDMGISVEPHAHANILAEYHKASRQDVDDAVADNPGIGAIVLECTDLPPCAAAIRMRTALPVYDIVTLLNMVNETIIEFY